MRRIIALAGGLAAAVAGTVAGGLIKPEVGSLVGQISAPRLETATAGPRTAPDVAEDPGVDAYEGEVPDYVIGTDWLPPPFEEDTTPVEPTEVAPVQVVTAASRARRAQADAVAALAAPLTKAPKITTEPPPNSGPVY